MKWTFVIQQKIKVALLLGSIMLLVVITNMMERKNIRDISRTFNSIYHDRLIPATDIFYLTEGLYNKRVLMERFLYADSAASRTQLNRELDIIDRRIELLISKFQKTFLVDRESRFLDEFKAKVAHYDRIEQEIMDVFTTRSRKEAQQLYETLGRVDLQHTIEFLAELTRIQSTVGAELIKDSQHIVSSSNLLSSLQIVIAIIVGILIQALVFSSRMVNQAGQRLGQN